MVRSVARFASVLAAAVVFGFPAAGQAMVEYGLAAAASANAAAAGASSGKGAIGGLFDTVNRALQGPGNGSEKAVQVEATPSAGSPKPKRVNNQPAAPRKAGANAPETSPLKEAVSPPDQPPAKYEDPNLIQLGTEYVELVRRFGPPAMSFTDGESSKLNYRSTEGTLEIEILEGKVTSIRKPGA